MTTSKAKKDTAAVSVRITPVGDPIVRADTSRQVYQEDAFRGVGIIPLNPPYQPSYLSQVIERSNMLKQCIEAKVTNVGRTGFDVSPVSPKVAMDEGEAEELQAFIDNANSEESLLTVHAKAVQDYEGYGYCFIEVIRNRAKRISLLRHVAALDTRLMPKDETPIPVTYDIQRGKRSTQVTEYRSFRRFAQIINGTPRYFREFGDPRTMNMDTGDFGPCPSSKEASEILHIRQQSDNPYGVPRWINQLPSILGSREAEECNLRYFEDNTIPPAILSVAGGRLTAQSYNELTAMLQKHGIGKDRQHQIMLIEAIPEREGLEDKGTVTLKLDKLTDARQGDGLFSTYDEANQAKVRSSFRLPPVAVGMSQDANFATANISAFVAETQVYAPDRAIFDEVYNKKLINGSQGLGLKTVRLASKVPMISNSEMLVKTLTALNVMGAITPRMANEAANKMLQIDIPEYPKKDAEGWEEWMELPIALSLRGSTENTQVEQSVKDPAVKQLEQDGNVEQKAPEHGQE